MRTPLNLPRIALIVFVAAGWEASAVKADAQAAGRRRVLVQDGKPLATIVTAAKFLPSPGVCPWRPQDRMFRYAKKGA